MNKYIISGFFSLMLLSTNTGVMAETLPGGACLPKYDTYSIERSVDGRMYNTGNSTQYWTCPIRSENFNLFNSGVSSANVYVVHEKENTSASCTLYAKSLTGASISSQTDSINLTGSSVQGISVGSVSGILNGNYYLRCTVRGLDASNNRSGIVSYYWIEN